MGNLIRNERLKQYKKVSTWIILGVVVLIMALVLVISKLANSASSYYQPSWQEVYTSEIAQYEAQAKDAEDTQTSSQAIQWQYRADAYRYLLENQIEPQDWRADVVLSRYDNLAQVESCKAQLQTEGLSEEDRAVIAAELERYQRLADEDAIRLSNSDWKDYVRSEIATAQTGDFESEAEKNVQVEIWQMYLDYTIEPFSSEYLDNSWKYAKVETENSWKLDELRSIREMKLALLRGENEYGQPFTSTTRANYEQEIEIATTRLSTNTAPVEPDSFLSYMDLSTSAISLLSIVMIVLAGGLIAGEFGGGTIKLLLITPHKRRAVFWAKAALVLELSLIGLAAMFVVAFVLSAILGGLQGIAGMQVVAVFGHVVRLPYLLFIVCKYLLFLLPVLCYAALALMLSAVTRKSAVSIAVPLLLMYGCQMVLAVIAALGKVIPGLKFLLFANTGLENYFSGVSIMTMGMSGTVDPSMTLLFSVCVLLVYLGCFLFIARDSFCRRDIK